ncbi:hypothetical protein [Natrinema longum]|uniref:hypothetical protein n=1 Tax=Natrinema longum TaxID=370324 RepID=UPI001CCC0543|nr:hypothetical protein [Natrinema longum]MBZ6496995.1 hypothetical protein [Natrinema longum]
MSVSEMFSTVFAPELFVLLTTVSLTGYELQWQEWGWKELVERVAVVVAAYTLAFVVYQGVPSAVSIQVPGGDDFFASTGLIVGFAMIWFAWRSRSWGELVPAYSAVIVATSVVHLVVVPFWDVSSHVVYAAVSSGFLTLADRRFAVFLLVPLGLVWSRVAVEAHSVVESVGGLVFAAVIVAITVLGRNVSTGRLATAK